MSGARAARVAGWGLLALTLAGLPWLVHPWYDATYDGSMYLACARSMLEGEGYAYLGEPFRMRPPGFSLLLAPFLAIAGTSFPVLNLFSSLCGAATVVALYAWCLRRLDWPLALVVALAVWFAPPFRELANQTLSDLPATALLLGCLLLERRASSCKSTGRQVALGLAIGAASLVRTANVLLVPAIVVARLQARLRGEGEASWRVFLLRRILPVIVLPILVLAPWSARNASLGFERPPDQHPLFDYSTAMWHQDKGDPTSPAITREQFLERSAERSRQVLASLGGRLRGEEPSLPAIAIGVLALCCTAFVAWRDGEAGDWLALGTAAVLGVYFGFAHRLVLPVALFALPAVVRGGVTLLAPAVGAARAAWAATAAVVLLAVVDFDPRPRWDEIEREHRARVELREDVQRLARPEDRLATSVGHHMTAFLGRDVVSLQIAWKRARDVEHARAILDEVLERHAVDAVVLRRDRVTDAALLAELEACHGPPSGVRDTLLVRVR